MMAKPKGLGRGLDVLLGGGAMDAFDAGSGRSQFSSLIIKPLGKLSCGCALGLLLMWLSNV
jgi:hypothetical protein